MMSAFFYEFLLILPIWNFAFVLHRQGIVMVKMYLRILRSVDCRYNVASLGRASGMIREGKFVGKTGIKQVGKYATIDSVSTESIGWRSKYLNEKLKDMDLSSEAIFAIYELTGIAIKDEAKYKAHRNSESRIRRT